MKIYKVFALLILVGLVVGCTAKTKLTLDKKKFAPGEGMTINYVAPSGLPSNAWIGIIPSGIPHGNETENDRHDISYKYLNKSTSGQMTFNVPKNPGKYDFRMHDTDSDGKELASVTFEVGE